MTTVRADPNKGPVKLEHDITPRDLRHIHMIGPSSHYELSDSHRFKGFPDSNFSQGRNPVVGSPKHIPSVSYKKPQHFVKGVARDVPYHDSSEESVRNGRPNVIAKNGVQYGSDEHNKSASLPVSPKKKTPFWNEDRTSAEERKKHRQMREAEWDRAQWKQHKEECNKATVEEKKKDLQMLREYKPFGRAGGGAPRGETHAAYRTKALHDEQLHIGPEVMLFPQFGKPGHGAPIRTDSGKLRTSIRANNDIRFRDGVGMRREVENTKRYSKPKEAGDKINMELGNMALETRTRKEMEKQMDKEEERKTWDYNPFGKSGAGAPIKTQSGNLVTGRARTLAKDPLELKQIEGKLYMQKLAPTTGDKVDYNPWGKGHGAPERDSEGNTKRLQWSDPTTAPEIYESVNTGVAMETKPFGGGGHVIDERGEKKTRFQVTLQNSSNPGGTLRGPLRQTESITHDDGKSGRDLSEPWGKPGAGAPIYGPDGKVHAANRGKATMDKMGFTAPKPEEVKAKQDYLNTLKTEIDNQKRQKQVEAKEVMMPGGETVNWIRSKEVGYTNRDPTTGSHLPAHHKGTSDITRHAMDIRRPGLDAQDYRTDLVQQAAERAQIKNMEKKESRQAVDQHYATFDERWGKPGNGAPYEPAMKRHSLDIEKFHEMKREPKPAQPWVRTKALEARFHDPSHQPAVPRQQPTVQPSQHLPTRAAAVVNGPYQVRAPWAAYTL